MSFMVMVDVPMYVGRLLGDNESGKLLLGLWQGLEELNTRWIVTHEIEEWRTELPWMSLYFSFAVLVSIGLCYLPLDKEKILVSFKGKEAK